MNAEIEELERKANAKESEAEQLWKQLKAKQLEAAELELKWEKASLEETELRHEMYRQMRQAMNVLMAFISSSPNKRPKITSGRMGSRSGA